MRDGCVLVMLLGTLLLCRGLVTRTRCRMMTAYSIDDLYSENEIIVEKSKFISKIGRVTSIGEANDFIHKHKDTKASHNCYSYRLRDGYTKGSDDGEPSGTAAMPIKKAIGTCLQIYFLHLLFAFA